MIASCNMFFEISKCEFMNIFRSITNNFRDEISEDRLYIVGKILTYLLWNRHQFLKISI
jgi:hypothetical protein